MTVFSPRSPPYFYPRSPRGERQSALVPGLPLGIFLSTLPARGATIQYLQALFEPAEFLSTLPARGATGAARRWGDGSGQISIHAPREGSDDGGVPASY